MGTITTWMGAKRGGSTRPLSSPWAMISAPIRRVETPQEVAHTYSCLPSLPVNCTSKDLAKFCPRKCEVPACRAFPSCIIASMVIVSRAPAKRSLGLLCPTTTGSARVLRAKSAYTCTISRALSCASWAVAWAVWPSCQRNSAVRRKRRVRISQRTTLHH